jgi:hypothetical protein
MRRQILACSIAIPLVVVLQAGACGGSDGGANGSGNRDGGGGGPGSDAPTEAAEGAADAPATDDGPGACPANQPRDGDACNGSASCQYGHSVCCGIDHSAFTCKCQFGTFQCAQTVECNIVCPEASPD